VFGDSVLLTGNGDGAEQLYSRVAESINDHARSLALVRLAVVSLGRADATAMTDRVAMAARHLRDHADPEALDALERTAARLVPLEHRGPPTPNDARTSLARWFTDAASVNRALRHTAATLRYQRHYRETVAILLDVAAADPEVRCDDLRLAHVVAVAAGDATLIAAVTEEEVESCPP